MLGKGKGEEWSDEFGSSVGFRLGLVITVCGCCVVGGFGGGSGGKVAMEAGTYAKDGGKECGSGSGNSASGDWACGAGWVRMEGRD